MIIKKLNTQQLINLLQKVQEEGYEFIDFEGITNSFQDTIKIYTKEEYIASKAIISSYKLNDDIINSLIN